MDFRHVTVYVTRKFKFAMSILQSFTCLLPLSGNTRNWKLFLWHCKKVGWGYFQKYMKGLLMLSAHSLNVAMYASLWKPCVFGILKTRGP